MWNKIKYYVLRYWVTISFIALAIYFYPTPNQISHCSPNELSVDSDYKKLFGLGEMTWMWLIMGVAHGANACYCDIKSLLKKNK